MTKHLSKFDQPGPQPGDPLPVEDQEPLSLKELAHLRIENALTDLKGDLHKDATAWRIAFNNLSQNVRVLLIQQQDQLRKLTVLVKSLEGKVTNLKTKANKAKPKAKKKVKK